ncbi:MAG: hypothetical protein [Bramyrmic virus 1]|nr:MAG: hypothetical protein [Bramyrmic virus 1]
MRCFDRMMRRNLVIISIQKSSDSRTSFEKETVAVITIRPVKFSDLKIVKWTSGRSGSGGISRLPTPFGILKSTTNLLPIVELLRVNTSALIIASSSSISLGLSSAAWKTNPISEAALNPLQTILRSSK